MATRLGYAPSRFGDGSGEAEAGVVLLIPIPPPPGCAWQRYLYATPLKERPAPHREMKRRMWPMRSA